MASRCRKSDRRKSRRLAGLTPACSASDPQLSVSTLSSCCSQSSPVAESQPSATEMQPTSSRTNRMRRRKVLRNRVQEPRRPLQPQSLLATCNTRLRLAAARRRLAGPSASTRSSRPLVEDPFENAESPPFLVDFDDVDDGARRETEEGPSGSGTSTHEPLASSSEGSRGRVEASSSPVPPARMIPGAVHGESYCRCPQQSQSRDLQCSCGEDETVYKCRLRTGKRRHERLGTGDVVRHNVEMIGDRDWAWFRHATLFEWTWDTVNKSVACEILHSERDVRFHSNYSSGTAAARGNVPMTNRQYFWEIKMTTPVYGTDMMVGVGTDEVNLDSNRYNFCSILGRDKNSWGLSYYGKTHHRGKMADVGKARFGQGSIIGMHLDTWQGKLTFYKNRKPSGVSFTGLRGKTLYPMVSSTAARTGMRLIRACSYETSLEFLCCTVLRRSVPAHRDVTEALKLPPGLHDFLVNNLSWLLRSNELSGDAGGRKEGRPGEDGSGPSKVFWSVAQRPRLTSASDESEFERPVKRARRRSTTSSSNDDDDDDE